MPGIEGITVALGNPRDGVRQAYPQAADSGSGDLSWPLDGIKFFFTKDDKVLREIMVEAPFTGSVDGIKIGDTAKDVVAGAASLTPSRMSMAAPAISITPAAIS